MDLEIRDTHCSCHPETCACMPCELLLGGKRVAIGYLNDLKRLLSCYMAELSERGSEHSMLRARIAELESQPADQFTAELVEIDGHAYGLRPGAARVVREALLDARRYKWLRDTPGVSWDELTDGGVSMWVGDASAIRAPSLDAAIDAAMAKDGA